MKIFYGAALTLLFSGVVVGQEFFTVLPGTHFPVELHGTIRVSKAKAGDPVEFRTIEPVLIGSNVVVPENAEIRGSVVFVRGDRNATPVYFMRIRLKELRWKTGQANLNAIVDGVHYVRSSYFDILHRGPRPTFLEGIHIDPHALTNASTDFFSDTKPVVLHDGIIVELRQVAPADDQGEPNISARTLAGKQ